MEASLITIVIQIAFIVPATYLLLSDGCSRYYKDCITFPILWGVIPIGIIILILITIYKEDAVAVKTVESMSKEKEVTEEKPRVPTPQAAEKQPDSNLDYWCHMTEASKESTLKKPESSNPKKSISSEKDNTQSSQMAISLTSADDLSGEVDNTLDYLTTSLVMKEPMQSSEVLTISRPVETVTVKEDFEKSTVIPTTARIETKIITEDFTLDYDNKIHPSGASRSNRSQSKTSRKRLSSNTSHTSSSKILKEDKPQTDNVKETIMVEEECTLDYGLQNPFKQTTSPPKTDEIKIVIETVKVSESDVSKVECSQDFILTSNQTETNENSEGYTRTSQCLKKLFSGE